MPGVRETRTKSSRKENKEFDGRNQRIQEKITKSQKEENKDYQVELTDQRENDVLINCN